MDEEKSFEILMHEKRVDAREKVRAFSKKRRKARFLATVFLAITLVLLSPVLSKLYDSENLFAFAAVLAGDTLISIFAYCLIGKFICGEKFLSKSRLVNAWKNASVQMDKMEEKSFERTAFEEDVQKAEEKIYRISESIIEKIGL